LQTSDFTPDTHVAASAECINADVTSEYYFIDIQFITFSEVYKGKPDVTGCCNQKTRPLQGAARLFTTFIQPY